MQILRSLARSAGVALALAAVSGGAVAQSMSASIDTPVTIKFYNYNLGSAGIGREATLEMIDAFQAANPMITVEGVAVSSAEVMSRVQADVIAGQGPDIAQIIFADLGYVVDNFGVPALEDVVPAADLSQHLDGLFPRGVELGRLDGRTYGLAYVFSTPVLFYNADLFRKAGLDPDAPPRTWEEVAAAAKAITASTGQAGLLTGIFGPSAYDWLYQGFIRSNGGRVMSEDRTTMMFGAPEAVEALGVLRDIAKAGAMPNLPSTSAIETMSSGNAGMYLQTSAVQGRMLKGAEGTFELRAAPMPTFGDKPATPTNSGSALVIMTRDPLKQRAAWELMKHLTSDYGYTIITSKIGYVPLRENAVRSEEHLAGFLRENPVVQPNIDQLQSLVPWVPLPGPNYRQILTVMMNASEQAVFGAQDDIAAIMADAQARAQALVPR
ncbi:ABC transporter substrate-binding protein [Polymorphum gilvum]|uniref:sn-glycerol-3-phosphate-binding periplasmic protein UgpB n=1 Tax=Polymorphum gilvum (strain LMG 25793 / CGMCC 1.9160 / SL003B-26A1) TaxID=991905 RepID=F2J1P9_POLGS|nr:ABC transporter substrate-binding protein [Polymorphum gilvum]ADZ70850.1 Glycerol-3-phosphate ABC transporter substrate-binding protein [Polymorphum gilvum SL003B-26A1]